MRDQAGIKKGSIETLDFDIITAGGTIITDTNQSPIKSTAHTRLKSIAIHPMASMSIPQAVDTAGIKLIVLADTNTPLKAIPTESLSN
jgi:hypothetical protein